MYRFLHVSIGPAFGFLNREGLHSRINDLSKDWLNYNNTCWILWTDKATITVSEMIMDSLNPADQIMVLGISDTDTPAGALPSWIWDWINRPRDCYTGQVLTPLLPAPAAVNLFAPQKSAAPPPPPPPGLPPR